MTWDFEYGVPYEMVSSNFYKFIFDGFCRKHGRNVQIWSLIIVPTHNFSLTDIEAICVSGCDEKYNTRKKTFNQKRMIIKENAIQIDFTDFTILMNNYLRIKVITKDKKYRRLLFKFITYPGFYY